MVEGCFRVWDLAKPVIGQAHGWRLAGGSELAVACDLVYVAEDAQIGYPPVRTMSPPDDQYHAWLMGMRPAMEMMLTGDAMGGEEVVRLGFANRAFKLAELETEEGGRRCPARSCLVSRTARPPRRSKQSGCPEHLL